MIPPRLDLDNAPHMAIGMGTTAAYHNGYKHGYQGVVTSGICALTKGTPEHKAWHDGYFDGENDSGQNDPLPAPHWLDPDPAPLNNDYNTGKG